MSLAVPPGCDGGMFAVGGGAGGASCGGAVAPVADCSASGVGKLSVFAEGVGSATSGSGGNGFGADAMADGSSGVASPTARGGDAFRAAGPVAGSCFASV